MNARRLAAVDALVERAPSAADLAAHGLEALAARRMHEAGAPVSDPLASAVLQATAASLAARPLLRRVQAIVQRPILIVKGPEVAAYYPDVSLRRFKDLDLFVEDAAEAQELMLRAGFVEVGDRERYVGIHHLRPLWWPTMPLTVELHTRPKWVDGLPSPSLADLLGVAVPSRTGVDGIMALPPPHHALVLAAHSWEHEPLRRVRDLVDIAMVIEGIERGEIERVATQWGVERLWRTSAAAIDALLGEGPQPWPFHVWARNLPRVRGRTVLESHLEHWLAAFSVLPPRAALARTASALAREARPAEGESWRVKLLRTRRAVRNAFVRRADHARQLEEEGLD